MKGYLYTKLLVLTSTNFCTKCSCHLKMWIFSSSNARLLARNETTSFSAAFFATFFRKPWNPKEFILLKIIPSPDNLIFEPIRCFRNLRKCLKYALGQKKTNFWRRFSKIFFVHKLMAVKIRLLHTVWPYFADITNMLPFLYDLY